MTASERLKYLMQRKNLTVTQFAKKIGIGRDTLNKMFANESNPKLPLLQKCLELYPDLNIEWLILGKGEMWKKKSVDVPKLEQEMAAVKAEIKKINERLAKKMIND